MTRLQHFLPVWHFGEYHETVIRATPTAVWAALKTVTAREIALFRTLTWIRRLGRPGAESILNPRPDDPIVDVALRTNFMLLEEVPEREIVLGITMRRPAGVAAPATADAFRALEGTPLIRSALNFRLELDGERCRLSTETRVQATGTANRLLFGMYWILIYPGSAFIRRMWLRAIRRRAEGA